MASKRQNKKNNAARRNAQPSAPREPVSEGVAPVEQQADAARPEEQPAAPGEMETTVAEAGRSVEPEQEQTPRDQAVLNGPAAEPSETPKEPDGEKQAEPAENTAELPLAAAPGPEQAPAQTEGAPKKARRRRPRKKKTDNGQSAGNAAENAREQAAEPSAETVRADGTKTDDVPAAERLSSEEKPEKAQSVPQEQTEKAAGPAADAGTSEQTPADGADREHDLTADQMERSAPEQDENAEKDAGRENDGADESQSGSGQEPPETEREKEPAADAKADTKKDQTDQETEELLLPNIPAGLLCPKPAEFDLPALPDGLSDRPNTDARAAKKQKRKKKKKKRKHHYFFWIFVFLTLAFAGASARYIYLMFTESDSTLFDVKEDVELPNLLGLRWADVENDAEYSAFRFEMVEVYHDEAPAGEIVDQNPRPPRHVKENSHIIVKVSKGVETVTVPDVAGWNRDTAREKLREMNLTVLFKPENNPDVPVDSVIRTEPEAGTLVKAGTTITVYIRREEKEAGYVTVPTCVGADSESQAGIRLTQRGLFMRTVRVEDDAPAGTIISQSPAPGAMVLRGTTVTLTISSGPPEPPAPEVPDGGGLIVPIPPIDFPSNPGLLNPGLNNPGADEPGTSDPGPTEPGVDDPGATDPGIGEPDPIPPDQDFPVD